MPEYINQLIDILSAEYSVEYYSETDGEYETIDCFILNDICIKLNRFDVETLSGHMLELLVSLIHEAYTQIMEMVYESNH